VELGFARREFLRGWLFRAASVRRWRRRRWGISFRGPSLVPVALYSDAGGGVGEVCTGVRGKWLVGR